MLPPTPLPLSVIIQLAVRSVLRAAYPDNVLEKVTVQVPQDPEHGDFATPVALQLAKMVGKQPRALAMELAPLLHDALRAKLPCEVTVAGAGFLNIKLTAPALAGQLGDLLRQGDRIGASPMGEGKVAVVEYSAPNIAKPLSVGHLRSTIIGESLKRIYNHCGYTVIADNYLGDFGTQFGKVIYAYKHWGQQEVVEKNPVQEFLALYIRFHKEAENDPALDAAAREEFRLLEQGDEENVAIWRWAVDASMEVLERMYERLDTSFTFIHGESFYQDMLRGVVQDMLIKGVGKLNDDGSVGVEFPDESLPSTIVRRSDGATLYLTRDLAADAYYEEQFCPRKVIHVVGADQTLYFRQLAAIRSMMGGTHEIVHASFGLVRLPEGKMSTRKGRVIFLEEFLDEAVERAYAVLKEREGFTEEEKREIAEVVGIGAVKYSDLSQNRKTDIVFQWDSMLQLQGNSGPYLQYTYARICSVFRKLKLDMTAAGSWVPDEDFFTNVVLGSEERLLARKMLSFADVVEQAAVECLPNLVCTYLFELASLYNVFYAKCPIASSAGDTRTLRLTLSAVTAAILKRGLGLLGITAPDRM